MAIKKDLKMKKTETAKTATKLDKKGKEDMKKSPLKSAPLKTSVKPAAKSTKKAEPKVKLEIAPKGKALAKGAAPTKGEKASGKKDKKSEVLEVVATLVTKSESDEEDEMDAAPASNGGGAEAGLASAAAAEVAAGSLKSFRHHPDLENFYRFIYENDLRYEALEIIDVIVSQRGMLKSVVGKPSVAARAK
jgi:hypothetical protein